MHVAMTRIEKPLSNFAILFTLSLAISGCTSSHSLEGEAANLENIQTHDFGPRIVIKSKE